ncbi:MAG: DUF2066 domain-containing protein [Pseudomonadota bacterium]
MTQKKKAPRARRWTVARFASLAAVALTGIISVAALTPTELYATAVPLPEVGEVTDEQAVADRDKAAYGRALALVLVRVTGQRDVASRPEAADLLENAQRYVQQFTTRTSELGEPELWVAFDGDALERAAAQAGLPIWNRDRPAVLIWLAVDRGNGERELVGADSDEPVRLAIEQIARNRGVPIVWPLLDSADMAATSVSDVWGGFGENVLAASARYRADVVLLSRLRAPTGQGAYGQWEVRTGAENQRFRGGVSQGINGLADYLVARLAASADVANVVSITVNNVYSVSAYSDVVNYLERLTLIDDLQLKAVQDDVLVFEASVRGDSARLQRAIELGRLLTPDPTEPGALIFRFAR